MLSFDSSIQKSADLKTQFSSGSWIERVLLTPYKQIEKKSKKVQNFSIKWLKTTNLQLSQKSFKTCLRKLIIIATFIPRNNLLFYFFKIKKIIKQTKKIEKIFRNCPQKSANGDAINIVNAFKVFWRRWNRRGHWKKKIKNQKNLKNQKIGQNFFVLIFRNCHKRCTRGRRLHPQRPQSVF